MDDAQRQPCPRCGAPNYANDDYCMSCGYDIPTRAAPPDLPTATPPIPGVSPPQPSPGAGALGVAAVLCALMPVAAYGIVFTSKLPHKEVYMWLAAVAWVLALALGKLTIWRGERGLGSAAIGLCTVELLVVVGFFVLCAALYVFGRAIAP